MNSMNLRIPIRNKHGIAPRARWSRSSARRQAAKTIHATQPTVSKAIKQLEDELGMPLLDRQDSPRLTGPAKSSIDAPCRCWRNATICAPNWMRCCAPAARRARLGLPRLGSSSLFAPLFARFRSRYPRIEISLVEHGSRRQEMVMAGEIELAATLRPVPDNFDWQPVAREPLIALAGGSSARRRGAVGLELRDTRHSVRDRFRVEPHPGCLPARGLHAHRRGARQATDFIVALVAAGLGVAFLPRIKADEPTPASAAVTRSRHRLGNGAGLAARRLSFTRGASLAGADASIQPRHRQVHLDTRRAPSRRAGVCSSRPSGALGSTRRAQPSYRTCPPSPVPPSAA